MSKVAVVYWSGTGNTEQMAESVADGARNAGADVTTFTAAEFDADKMDEFDAIAFGCPSMGAEQLEEDEFEPMFTACESKLSGKKIALLCVIWMLRFLEKQLLYLVPMDGEMVSGCATGMRPAAMTAL